MRRVVSLYRKSVDISPEEMEEKVDEIKEDREFGGIVKIAPDEEGFSLVRKKQKESAETVRQVRPPAPKTKGVGEYKDPLELYREFIDRLDKEASR